MLVVFEVHVAPGSDPSQILSAETARETQAQVMTPEEARKVGFSGLPDTGNAVVRYVAVAARDKAWILRALETNEAVGGFKVHEVG